MSSLLYRVFFAWKCTSTHHKLALDALRHLRGDDAEQWMNLFLRHIETYLAGSKAPDDKFKDFRNHVMHVRENYWGGAIAAAEKWYQQTVVALKEQRWSDAVYAAGVLSHYYTDPIQPFHTGQSEEEGIVHRAAEWSIAKSYEQFQFMLEKELGGYPEIECPKGSDWLGRMIRMGAEEANPHYEPIIEHYDLAKGVKDPPAGLDQDIRERIAPLVGHAAVGYARILEKAIAEAQAKPPSTSVSLLGVLAALTVPLFWITKKLADGKDRAAVQKIYAEFQESGKVLKALPEDEATVRRLHAEEVLKTPLAKLDAQKPRPVGAKHVGPKPPPAKPAPEKKVERKVEKEPVAQKPSAQKPTPEPVKTPRIAELPPEPKKSPEPAKPQVSLKPTVTLSAQSSVRFYLNKSQAIQDAPSIGPKLAERFTKVGIKTVGDLLALDAASVVRKLAVRNFDPDLIRTWQAQCVLVCCVPGLRGHDAQILVGCGIREPQELADCEAKELFVEVEAFVATSAGERILRGGPKPDLAEVRDWITAAQQARSLKAA